VRFQRAQTNGVERVKRFVNVHLHGIVSNLLRISKIWTLPPPYKNFCGHPGMHWFRSNSWVIKSVVLFGSNLLSLLKTINAKIISFPDLYTKRSNQKAL